MTQLLDIAFSGDAGIFPRDPIGWETIVDDPTLISYIEDTEIITGRAWELGTDTRVQLSPSGAATAQATSHLTISLGVSVNWPVFISDGDAEPILAQHGELTNSTWRLQAHTVDSTARTVQLSLSWSTGAVWRVIGGPIIKLDRPVIILVSRERTPTGFSVRWAVNGEPAGATAGIPIDIVVTSAGSALVTVGDAHDFTAPAAGWRFEWLQVTNEPTTLEEMVAVGRRFAVTAPQMIAAMRRLVPEGVYSRDPSSFLDREIRVEGVAASWFRGAADYLLAAMPPGRSFGPLLDRWEDVLRPGTAPGADLATRQEALANHLRLSGSALDEIKVALEPVLGLDASAIVIDELDTTEYDETFATTVTSGGYYVSGFDAARWVTVGGARFTFAHVGGSGLYRISRTLAADDMRYLGRVTYGSADTSTPFLLHPTGESGRDTWWEMEIAAVTMPALNIVAGFVVGDVEDDEWLWIGIYSDGATKLGYVRYTGHLMAGSITSIATVSAPRFLRVRDLGNGTFNVQHNATLPADWNAIGVTNVPGPRRARWAGPGIAGVNTSASGAIVLDVGRYWDRAPHGPGRLSWQAFRDPLLPGTYDLQAADLVVQRVSPTHVEGTPITHRRGIYTDDATTLLDRDPLRT